MSILQSKIAFRIFQSILSGAIFWFFIEFAIAEILIGKVLSVSDGDTIKLQSVDNRLKTVRLAGIDAPEKSQDFGDQARRELSQLCLHQPVEADMRTTDRYGRTVARVRCNGVDAASKLLVEGLAWHFTRYASSQPVQEAYDDRKSHESAKVAQRGLWSLPDPIAPWDWRAKQRDLK